MLLSQTLRSRSTTWDSATAGPSSEKVAYVAGGCLGLFDNAVE
jgi:hypothetical protein